VTDPQGDRHALGFLPAASYHAFTPLYDLGSRLLGAGPRFKERVVGAAGITDGDRVLDLACGTGILAAIVKRRYPASQVWGVDVDPSRLRKNRG
jgi:ubiquinone/menaquinone biosynthesis C-methylase UbiE